MGNQKYKLFNDNTSIKNIVYKVFGLLFAVFWLFVAGGPLYYLATISLKEQSEYLNSGIFTLPKTFYLGNYFTVINGNFRFYFLNSLFVLAISLSLLLMISSFAAYPLSRMKFRLNRPIFSLIVACMSIPIHITLIPVFILMLNLKLYNNLLALIGPNVAFNLPISVFILSAFMQSISGEMEEASEIDGCGKFRTFFKIIFPLSKPGLATIAIYDGVIIWNEFSFAMVLTQTVKAQTLPLGIWTYKGQYSMDIPLIMAFLIFSALPIILLYVFGQDKLVKGMMAGAVKG